MTPDPLTFAQEALGCRRFASYGPCATHGDAWPCFAAEALAALIEARDAQIRADECEKAAALVRARVAADNADIGPNGRALERRAIAKALRERATQHRGDTNA